MCWHASAILREDNNPYSVWKTNTSNEVYTTVVMVLFTVAYKIQLKLLQ